MIQFHPLKDLYCFMEPEARNVSETLEVWTQYRVGFPISSKQGYFLEMKETRITACDSSTNRWGTSLELMYRKMNVKRFDRYGMLKEEKAVWTLVEESNIHHDDKATAGNQIIENCSACLISDKNS